MAVEEAIVLVGGLGTRLRQVVPDLPKPLAPVAGRPFLAWLLDALAGARMRRVILATGHMAEAVESVVGRGWGDMEVVYSREHAPLGTGGAVRLAARHVSGDGVHLLNGDTWLRYHPAGLEAATRRAGCALGIALAAVDDVARYGAVEVSDGKVAGFREKGGTGAGLINAGSYFLTGAALRGLPDVQAFSFEERVLAPMAMRGEVAAFADTAGFIDIGVPEDYARAQSMFAEAR